jgi:hypothetical protein
VVETNKQKGNFFFLIYSLKSPLQMKPSPTVDAAVAIDFAAA